jgi:hypothetical protein
MGNGRGEQGARPREEKSMRVGMRPISDLLASLPAPTCKLSSEASSNSVIGLITATE